MRSDEWREFDRDARRGGARIGMWIVVALLFCGVMGGLFWGWRVVTSPIKGQGDSIITKNSASNRIAAQQAYVTTMNAVKQADRQLDVLAAAQKDSAAAKTRYVGAISYCQSVVANYDALFEKYLTADFIPPGYPQTIDPFDPATDCKEGVTP